MRGHLLCEMNVPFGPRFGFGPFHGHRGQSGPQNFTFASPCGFESFGGFRGFGPRPHPGPHKPCRGDRSPDKECRRDHYWEHGSFGRGKHGDPHRYRRPSSPPEPHGRSCSPGPYEKHGHWRHGHGPHSHGFHDLGSKGCGPHRHGPHGHGLHRHGPDGHGPRGHGPHGHEHHRPCCQTNGPWGRDCPPPEYEVCSRPECEKQCSCNQQKQPAQGSGENSGPRRRHRRCGYRDSPYRKNERNEEGSPDRSGRFRRRCCRRNKSCNRTGNDLNPTNECVARDDGAVDTEERDGNQGPAILVQNIVVDNTPRSNSV